IVAANYEDAYAAAGLLREEVKGFVREPTEARMVAAKEAWVAARVPYLQTEAFRFYDGPIDGDEGPEGMINAWPMDESYIDYVAGNEDAGIIGDREAFPKISAGLLRRINELGGETNIAAGFHAIEFLLWGQDLNVDGPGARPLEDYTTAKNADRRGDFLLACVDLLEANLEELVVAWDGGGSGNYREEFTGAPAGDSLTKMVRGITMMAGHELSGERLLVAYDTQAQEDEHSCFSDTTHIDARYDALGIANVYFGEYVRTSGETVKGPSLKSLAEAIDGDLERRLDAAIKLATDRCAAIPAPFDQAITGADSAPGRVAVMGAVEALEDAAVLLRELAGKLGFELPDTGDIDG
ncbi:MAG: imelysin family protein, partial [Verrucomicrobiales bacterium]|nr:imelysin family protein [Verrucomicrobiales bacterium]